MKTEPLPLVIPSGSGSSRSTALANAPKDTALSSWLSFSVPTISTTSDWPDATDNHPRCKAELPDAHAFSILNMGVPARPVLRNDDWARIISWPVTTPAAALPKYTCSMSSADTPASFNAAATASSDNDFMLRSRNRPNGVMPTPATTTFLISASLTQLAGNPGRNDRPMAAHHV